MYNIEGIVKEKILKVTKKFYLRNYNTGAIQKLTYFLDHCS